jgi:hypothetical protein
MVNMASDDSLKFLHLSDIHFSKEAVQGIEEMDPIGWTAILKNLGKLRTRSRNKVMTIVTYDRGDKAFHRLIIN